MATREALLAEYDHEMAATRRLLTCVTDDRLVWTPHERSRTLGALALHIARIPGWATHIVEAARFDLDELPVLDAEPVSRAQILQLFDENARSTRRALDRSDAELNAPWSLDRGGQSMFSMPRAAAVRTFVLGHVVHHRGQLTVYLRLNGIPVPAIYGPTADSGT